MRTLRCQLLEKGFVESVKLKKADSEVLRKRKEQLTRREIEEMMGINRDTYKRGKGGAVRRR